MSWFSVTIDPLLIYLTWVGTPPTPVSEVYKVFGYADDIKPGVSSMSEFALVDKAAKMFELSSGCVLQRDPVTGKCKVLPHGRWRQSLQQEDISFSYMKICDSLSMVGVELTASWVTTRKLNNDELQKRVQSCIGSWKAGKFMPFISRTFSINTYCTSKVLYCYQDLYQKPSEVLWQKSRRGWTWNVSCAEQGSGSPELNLHPDCCK